MYDLCNKRNSNERTALMLVTHTKRKYAALWLETETQIRELCTSLTVNLIA